MIEDNSNQTGFAAFRYESKNLDPSFKSNSKYGTQNFQFNSDFWINTTESINIINNASNKLKFNKEFDVDICKKRPQTTYWSKFFSFKISFYSNNEFISNLRIYT